MVLSVPPLSRPIQNRDRYSRCTFSASVTKCSTFDADELVAFHWYFCWSLSFCFSTSTVRGLILQVDCFRYAMIPPAYSCGLIVTAPMNHKPTASSSLILLVPDRLLHVWICALVCVQCERIHHVPAISYCESFTVIVFSGRSVGLWSTLSSSQE